MVIEKFALRRPIIIIGAARSGTKMLRAAIASHPRIVAIPYDINYVWKIGNYNIPHDELNPMMLSGAAKTYIQWYFRRFQGLTTKRVVEKTVSNTLRISYVRAVFPSCQFIHIYRDGRDVAASARRMWKSPLDWKATLLKALRFPLAAIPSYGLDYAKSYLSRRFNQEGHVSSWGPRFDGIDEISNKSSLLEICGWQWRKCIEKAHNDLNKIHKSQVLHVRYEDFVLNPLDGLKRITDFLDLDMVEETYRYADTVVVDRNLGKWKREITEAELGPLLDIIEPTLKSLGYITA
jgi:hypothetical protein